MSLLVPVCMADRGLLLAVAGTFSYLQGPSPTMSVNGPPKAFATPSYVSR